MKPIYKPSGRAKEYGELALNIYAGCNHGCTYCYAPLVLKKDRAEFHASVTPRKNIVEATKRQLDKEQITGKLIHLCFTCDPYPAMIDTMPTREVIKAIKAIGNNVQILTKGGVRAERDFDLLGEGDWFGVSISGDDESSYRKSEPNAADVYDRIMALRYSKAYESGIKTWVSCEPVIVPRMIFQMIEKYDFIDLFRIGKTNYCQSDIDWAGFGVECIRLCEKHGRNYHIKEDLRRIMETENTP